MIRNAAMYAAFQRRQIRQEPVDYQRNLRIFEAMYDYARQMGAIDSSRPLEGIESRIRLARALHAQGTHRQNNAGAE